MTTQEAKKFISGDIEKSFGKPFELLKKDILKTIKYGSSDHFKSKNGYSLFFTDNENFMQGKHNGGGTGFYARLQFCGSCRDIKIE